MCCCVFCQIRWLKIQDVASDDSMMTSGNNVVTVEASDSTSHKQQWSIPDLATPTAVTSRACGVARGDVVLDSGFKSDWHLNSTHHDTRLSLATRHIHHTHHSPHSTSQKLPSSTMTSPRFNGNNNASMRHMFGDSFFQPSTSQYSSSFSASQNKQSSFVDRRFESDHNSWIFNDSHHIALGNSSGIYHTGPETAAATTEVCLQGSGVRVTSSSLVFEASRSSHSLQPHISSCEQRMTSLDSNACKLREALKKF